MSPGGGSQGGPVHGGGPLGGATLGGATTGGATLGGATRNRGGATAALASPETAASPREVPFCRTEITAEAQRAVLDVLSSGWVTMGAESAAFEQEFAAWVGAPHAIAVSSCTAAIQLALMALDLPPGSPVLTPTLTFCGAVQAIVHAGLRPVLVDADPGTLGVSAESVAAAAARGGAAAMVVQHMAGYPLDSAELAAAAGISVRAVVEDAAHGLGGSVRGTPVGSDSLAACFSFYATKNLPIGEGGAITTVDAGLAARLRRMRLHGMSGDAWRRYHRSGSWRYSVAESGMKANFTDIQAAIGRAQLRSLGGWQQRRAEIAAQYDRLLAGIPGVGLPPRPADGGHAWHLYIVRVLDEFGMHRDQVVADLGAAGIGTSVHFIPVHHQPYFRDLLGADACSGLTAADAIFPHLLSLPLHPGMSDADVTAVCDALATLAAR
ncbi:MAG: DegT/DnrJ/EryC1/StrS family aminotransferase [Actinomycetota bacterium]|nr:DegT/DnrJ/EryC1/StrS family aminotransferase [Actinomycetota bacterium]